MISLFWLESERGRIQSVDESWNFQAILARDCSDIAVVADRVKTKLLEDRNGFGILLFYVTNDHVAADQFIESEHRHTFGAMIVHPVFQNESLTFS